MTSGGSEFSVQGFFPSMVAMDQRRDDSFEMVKGVAFFHHAAEGAYFFISESPVPQKDGVSGFSQISRLLRS